MKTDRLPVTPRLCFNWLPTYRYALFAYKGLQQLCAGKLELTSSGLTLSNREVPTTPSVPFHLIRPVAIDSLLEIEGHSGYLGWQFSDVLQKFSDGKNYLALTEDMALVVADPDKSKDLMNNVIPYMTAAPATNTAILAVAGGYAQISATNVKEAHLGRKAATETLKRELATAYNTSTENILVHVNAVGGLIEGTMRYLSRTKPNFNTTCFAPEYWDFLRLAITYSGRNLSLVPGRDSEEIPKENWLKAVSEPNIDLCYLSFTANPVGTTIPEELFFRTLDALSDDTLFFIDCTSIDTEQRSHVGFLREVLQKYKHKNLLITKSFSKEYELGDVRVGYALFTRPEMAKVIWPYMAAYPGEKSIEMALAALKAGNDGVMEHYKKANNLLKQLAEKTPNLRFTGDCSNYTLVQFKTEGECAKMKAKLGEMYGDAIYPGELPMIGGGDIGLGEGEFDLTSIKSVPFLSANSLRLVVTPESVRAFGKVVKN